MSNYMSQFTRFTNTNISYFCFWLLCFFFGELGVETPHGGVTHEDELLRQIRDELQQDDEIDACLQEHENPSKPSADATTKTGKRYAQRAQSKRATEKTITIDAVSLEPPSKFMALASSLSTAFAVSRL